MLKLSKIWAAILLAVLLLPVGTGFANPSDAGNVCYLYLTPQNDGSILFDYKFTGTEQKEMNFPVAEDATDLKAVAGAEIADGKVVAEIKDGKVSLNYTFKSKTKSITYSTPFSNTLLTVLIPAGEGSISSEDAVISGEEEPMAFGDKTYQLFMATIEEANKPIKMEFAAGEQPASDKKEEQATSATEPADSEDIVSDVKKESTGFHTPGHIRLWNESPFRNINPHLFMIALSVILLGGVGFYIYFRIRDRKQAHGPEGELDEEEFVSLVARRNAILKRVTEMEEAHAKGELTDEDYNQKEAAYRKQLVQVTLDLRKYTE